MGRNEAHPPLGRAELEQSSCSLLFDMEARQLLAILSVCANLSSYHALLRAIVVAFPSALLAAFLQESSESGSCCDSNDQDISNLEHLVEKINLLARPSDDFEEKVFCSLDRLPHTHVSGYLVLSPYSENRGAHTRLACILQLASRGRSSKPRRFLLYRRCSPMSAV